MTARDIEADAEPAPDHPADVEDAIWSGYARRWQLWAGTKKPELDLETFAHDDRPEFLEELLPFAGHPRYVEAPPERKRAMLAAGWIAYNEKVVQVETDLISPACHTLIAGHFPIADKRGLRLTIAQTLVDEAYHVFIVLRACDATRARTGLHELRLPKFRMVERMEQAAECMHEPWQRSLMRLLCATAIETSISDYLRLLSTASSIHPLNRITTEMHRRDEAVHAGIFRVLARELYAGLNETQREFFSSWLPFPWLWFADTEFGVWRSILPQLAFPHERELLADCFDREPKLGPSAVTAITRFAEDLDIVGRWGDDLNGWIEAQRQRSAGRSS